MNKSTHYIVGVLIGIAIGAELARLHTTFVFVPLPDKPEVKDSEK